MNACSLGGVQFAWMASPRLDLGKRPHSPTDLARWPVIGLKHSSYHYAPIEDWFRRGNARCRYLARCKSMAVAASMTVAGLGIAFLPIRCYREALDRGELEILRTTSAFPKVEFLAILPADEHHSLARRVAQMADQTSDFDRNGEAMARPME